MPPPPQKNRVSQNFMLNQQQHFFPTNFTGSLTEKNNKATVYPHPAPGRPRYTYRWKQVTLLRRTSPKTVTTYQPWEDA